jgi:hypothetical protein
MSDAIAAALYGTPSNAPAPGASAPAVVPMRSRSETISDSRTAAKLYGPAPTPPAPRDPAALKLATAMRGGRGVESEETKPVIVPAKIDKPHGTAAYAARAAEGEQQQSDDAQQVEPKGTDEPPASDAPVLTLTDEARRNLAPVMRDIEAVSVQRLGLSSADARANAETSAAWFDAFGIDSSTGSALTEYAVGIVTRDISDAQRMQWRRESRDVIAQEVGPDNVDRAIAQAQKLVALHPQVRDWLSATGAGDHPMFVRSVVNAAWRMRNEGTL